MQTATPSSPPHRLLTVLAGWTLVALLIVVCGGHTLVRAWQSLNTDFPNYYLTARLVHERADTNRIYEWTWFQRQKDHHVIDQPLVALSAITPISTLAVYPLSSLAPLTAKHCWIVLNIGLLLWTILLLTSLTDLPLHRVALLAALSLPLYTNLLYGQYYILLLFVLTLACWLYLHQRRFLSGIAIAVATALKIFPALYIVYFLRKRDWKALAGALTGLAALAVVSCSVFGWQLNRVYLQQLLPSPLRGETINPYQLTSSSISVLLHHLFLFEPQWNPHPVLHAPILFATMQALLPMLVLAPILLLITPSGDTRQTLRLEWAAILLLTLTVSTSPSHYHFTLLLLPVCILLAPLLQTRRYTASAILIALYLLAGLRVWAIHNSDGWHALLGVPRLYAMLLLCLFAAWLLLREHPPQADKTRIPWVIALALLLLVNIVTGIRHQRGLYDDYANRIPAPNYLLTGSPAMFGDTLHAIAIVARGYRAISLPLQNSDTQAGPDHLSLAAGNNQLWVEESTAHSTLLSADTLIPGAELPVLSADQHHLVYLREQSGRGRLWLRDLTQPDPGDHQLTPPSFNVFESTFAANGDLVFSAMQGNSPVAIFRVNAAGTVSPLLPAESRYPAISPDGRWLAYSRMQNGSWHLWLADLRTGAESRLTGADCNFIQPSWQSDSQTLLYATDCGRAPGLTVLSRRRVVP